MVVEIAWVQTARAIASAAGNIARAYKSFQGDGRSERKRRLGIRADAALRHEKAPSLLLSHHDKVIRVSRATLMLFATLTILVVLAVRSIPAYANDYRTT